MSILIFWLVILKIDVLFKLDAFFTLTTTVQLFATVRKMPCGAKMRGILNVVPSLNRVGLQKVQRLHVRIWRQRLKKRLWLLGWLKSCSLGMVGDLNQELLRSILKMPLFDGKLRWVFWFAGREFLRTNGGKISKN